MKIFRSPIVRVLAALFALVLTATMLTGTASATHTRLHQPNGDYRYSGTGILKGRYLTAPKAGYGYPTQRLYSICGRTGAGVYDNRTGRYDYFWVYHRNARTGDYGWTNAARLNMWNAVRQCG